MANDQTYMKLIYVMIVSLNSFTYAANILVAVPVATQSHVNIFVPIVEELSKQHQITIVTIIPFKNTNENVTQIILQAENEIEDRKDMMKSFLSSMLSTSYMIRSEIQFSFILMTSYDGKNNFFTTYLKNEELINIMNSTKPFDLMFLDGYICELFLSLNYKHQAPVILMTPSMLFPWTNALMGNPINYGFDPQFFFGSPKDNLMDRTWRTIYGCFIHAFYNWYALSSVNEMKNEYFPWITSSIEELSENVVLVLANTHHAMGYSRSNIPGIIDIGGIHIKPAKPLSQEIEKFLSNSDENSFIYFSFGGTMRGDLFPDYIIESFLTAFRNISCKVIWKMERNLTDVPKNVYISPWLPQQDILGDSRIKLFITQAGMLSVQEAAYNGVPILAIPIIVDQYSNSDIAVDSGYAIRLNIQELNSESIKNVLNEMTSNSKYKKNAQKISSLMKDTPMTSKERAVWWTEYVLRQKNNVNLKSKLANKPWYQGLQLDVIIIIFSCITVLCIISTIFLIYFFKLIYKIYFKIRKIRSVKIKNKSE